MAFLDAKNLIIFAKNFVIFLRLRKIVNSEFSEHYEKMMLKKIAKNSFRLEHSSSSLECRALLGSLSGSNKGTRFFTYFRLGPSPLLIGVPCWDCCIIGIGTLAF